MDRSDLSSRDGLVRHVGLAFLLALGFYVLFFNGLERYRVRRGPWLVTFATQSNGVPSVTVAQPRLGVVHYSLVFAGETVPPMPAPQTLAFSQPTQRKVPFGRVLFLDTTFLPGTVTLELFGHVVEFLPRVLTIDKQEFRWLAETQQVVARHH